jgi:hypothetical protein
LGASHPVLGGVQHGLRQLNSLRRLLACALPLGAKPGGVLPQPRSMPAQPLRTLVGFTFTLVGFDFTLVGFTFTLVRIMVTLVRRTLTLGDLVLAFL